jgi:phosphatidylglycerophosphate synthase
MLLGPIERPLLQWLVARLPAWATPDMMTALGVIGSVIIFLCFWLTSIDKAFLWLVNLGFVINWFGDSLDGTLARYRKIERPKFGFFVDHTYDVFSQVLVFTGLGLSRYVTFNIAYFALVGYLLMSIFSYVHTIVTGVFQISFGKLGPTEGRVVVILLNTFVFFLGNPRIVSSPLTLRFYDMVVLLVGGMLILMYISYTLRATKKLFDIDAKKD